MTLSYANGPGYGMILNDDGSRKNLTGTIFGESFTNLNVSLEKQIIAIFTVQIRILYIRVRFQAGKSLMEVILNFKINLFQLSFIGIIILGLIFFFNFKVMMWPFLH